MCFGWWGGAGLSAQLQVESGYPARTGSGSGTGCAVLSRPGRGSVRSQILALPTGPSVPIRLPTFDQK